MQRLCMGTSLHRRPSEETEFDLYLDHRKTGKTAHTDGPKHIRYKEIVGRSIARIWLSLLSLPHFGLDFPGHCSHHARGW